MGVWLVNHLIKKRKRPEKQPFLSCGFFIAGNARKKDKYKRMKQQEVKKDLKIKAAKAGGKVTPITGTKTRLKVKL